VFYTLFNTASIQENIRFTTTIAHINQHILHSYAIKTKQTYQLLDGASTSYIIRSK